MDTLKCCICEDYLKNIMFGFMKQFQFLIVHQEWLKTLGWKRDANNTQPEHQCVTESTSPQAPCQEPEQYMIIT